MPKKNIYYELFVSLKATKLLFTVQQLCIFQKKNEEKLFWVIEAINEAIVTNSIMNFSYTLYVITDGKALCSVLYSFENISHIKLAKISVSRGLNQKQNEK